jgi:hypothetical protein
VGSLDLPDQPDEAGRAERAGARGADQPDAKPREIPDPDERGRAYEATQAYVSAETRAHVSAETPAYVSAETRAELSSGRQPDRSDERSYRTEVPRFEQIWAEHEERWPKTPRPVGGLSSDASEPHRKDGSSLSGPEGQAVNEVVRKVREAEEGLSADVQAIQQENKYGGWLEGFEFRLKDEDRLNEKITEKLDAEPRMTAAQALGEVADAIRYTYCFQPEKYTRGFYDIKERLESRECEMFYCKNWWENPEYKGVNTRWVTAEGQRFEVQLHTPDSFHAKHHVTHLAYERIRDQATSRAELRELHAFQREVSSWVQVPDGAADIPDYRKEGF